MNSPIFRLKDFTSTVILGKLNLSGKDNSKKVRSIVKRNNDSIKRSEKTAKNLKTKYGSVKLPWE